MLLFTDNDILAYSAKSDDAELELLLAQIKSRTLPKRAFVFHREYLEEIENVETIQENVALPTKWWKEISLNSPSETESHF
jgi:hypothetical protein